MNKLDAQFIAAHEANDTSLLIRLYTQAADETETEEAAGFFLTHAYVFALEAGAPEAPALRQRLVDMGRETGL